MTTEVATIAFHIGAHKTATSHLQRCLTKASEDLAQQGVRYYGPQYFRQRRHAIQGLFGLRPPANPKLIRRSPTDQLAIMRKDGHRLVFSEENFIGPLNDPQGQPVVGRYVAAGERLTSLAQALDQDLDIFVSVRRPTAYLNSAYCQMLLGGLVCSSDAYQANNPLSSINWADLIAQVRAAKGVGRVVVWRYEDYAQLFPDILADLVGAAQAPLVPWVTRNVNTGLSQAAVAQVLAHPADEDAAQVGYAARGARPVEAGFTAFDGYSAAEHAAGDAVYATQLAAIAAMDGVTLLQPANA
jgi:hypothetical protein